MRKIIFIVSALIYTATSNAQEVCIKDTAKYLAAYNYIINDTINKNKAIYVSDSIIDLDRFWYKDLLNPYPEELQTIKKLEKYNWFEDFYSPVINALFGNKYKYSKTILFFSTIEDNTLCADLIHDKLYYGEYSYAMITMINPYIYSYLFFFNDDNSIKLVLRTQMDGL